MSSLSDFLNAMASQESGGSYNAVNKNTGALGKWQVMPNNVPAWGKQYLGMNITTTQFKNSPALQDRLVGAVLGSYVSKYGYRGAAAKWYSGQEKLASNYNPQKFGPSIGGYVDSVLKKMGSSSGGIATAAASQQAIDDIDKNTPGPGLIPPTGGELGMDPNPFGLDRDPNEAKASQGLGLDIQDGSGQGQLGITAGQGVDSTDPFQGAITSDTAGLDGRAAVGQPALGGDSAPASSNNSGDSILGGTAGGASPLGRFVPNSGTSAAAKAANTKNWQVNGCLNFVWNMLGRPPTTGLPDANSSWRAAVQKETRGVPPAGAPVYWQSGQYGHVAISAGNGNVYSTDYPRKGQVGLVSIANLTKQWNVQYRGWSHDYAGYSIKGVK